MLEPVFLSCSNCIKPLKEQCKNCYWQNKVVLNDKRCSSAENVIQNAILYEHGLSCKIFTPKNKEFCEKCNIKLECLLGVKEKKIYGQS